jgi:hypothetical protein
MELAKRAESTRYSNTASGDESGAEPGDHGAGLGFVGTAFDIVVG